jgi:hypothetical protein
MASQADIDHQQRLLSVYRQNLSAYLRQQAQLGGVGSSSPAIQNDIAQQREQIRRIKSLLRSWGVVAGDLPDDVEAEPSKSAEQKHSPVPQMPAFDIGDLQSLHRRLSALIEDYVIVARQIDVVRDAGNRVRVQSRLKGVQKAIDEYIDRLRYEINDILASPPYALETQKRERLDKLLNHYMNMGGILRTSSKSNDLDRLRSLMWEAEQIIVWLEQNGKSATSSNQAAGNPG